MSFTNYLENEFLDHILKNGTFTPPTIYVGLSTANPTEDGSGISEPSSGNYARVNFSDWTCTSGTRTATNASQITFNQATAGWGTISHWFIADASDDGNYLVYGSFTSSRIVNSGNTPRISSGNMTIEFLTSGISDFLADEWMDHLFNGDVFPEPPDLKVGLSTANPTDDGSGISEPAGGSYAQVSHTDWDAASGGTSSNGSTITFPTATGSWGTISDVFINDSDDNLLLYSFLADSGGDAQTQAVVSGDSVQFSGGSYDISVN